MASNNHDDGADYEARIMNYKQRRKSLAAVADNGSSLATEYNRVDLTVGTFRKQNPLH